MGGCAQYIPYQRSAGQLKFCPATAPPRPAKCILQEMIFSKNSASVITTILFHKMNKIDMIYNGCSRKNGHFLFQNYLSEFLR